MVDEILFEVTKDQLETGMRGYPVGYCITSYVDPMKGLFYRGRPVAELANWECERVIFLLYYGREGSAQEIETFAHELKKRSQCSRAAVKFIENLPRQGHPMKLFGAALIILGMLEGQNDYEIDALNLIAKIPHLTAIVINHHAGWGNTKEPEDQKNYIENFSHMLRAPSDHKENLKEILRLFNILHYDHGGGNLSAFVGKAVASGLEDLYGSLAASLMALEGPRHGRANQDCLQFVQAVLDKVGENATGQEVENLLRQRLEKKELIFGFGHAVLRAEDPRATLLYEFGEKQFSNHPLMKIALLLRTAGTRVLKENPKITNPYPNVDGISGAVLTAAGFGFPKYFTVLFGMSRIVGICIQIIYERLRARKGKGTPIVRPRYLYKSE